MATRTLRYFTVMSCVAMLAAPCCAEPAALPEQAAAVACAAVAGQIEQEYGIPAGLMLAIGRQESGRLVAGANAFLPFPFSVDAAGESHFFASEQEAISYVTMQLATGVRSIDVGCFQINLLAHPTAFASLHEGFDPLLNGRYAARFLRLLHEQAGNWPDAVARYHSSNPVLGVPYMAAVLQRWTNGDTVAFRDERVAGISAAAPAAPHPVAGIMVQRPGDASGGAIAVVSLARGLPRVIRPGRS
jgi:hypothetical protein